MKYILGIDIGTGSTKAVAVNLQQKAFESSQYFYPTQSTQPGYSEQNPELIWEAFKMSISEVLNKADGELAGLSLSSAMHSLIAVDDKCNALLPMMTWADSRSISIAENLLSNSTGIALYRATGTPVHSMSPLCKIIWIKENDPELFKSVHKFISIKEYIWYRLFGVFEVDYSIASCTGLMNTENLRWDELALSSCGVSGAQLSELVATDHSRKYARKLPGLENLQANTPIVIGASDGCLANLGSGAVKPGSAALTIGTSGALRVASNKAVFSEQGMTFSYHLDKDIFINGGAVNNGGIALKWHLKNLLNQNEISSADYENELGKTNQVRPGSAGLVFLPYLQGERAPIWDSMSSGVFFGMRLIHTPAHFTRAVLEGICFALNDVLASLHESGQDVHQLHVSGGFISSPEWLQIMADITGKKLIRVTTEDASATGAAFLGMKSLALTAEYPLPDQEERTFIMPNIDNHIIYKEYFGIYKKIYQQLKGTMRELYLLQMKGTELE